METSNLINFPKLFNVQALDKEPAPYHCWLIIEIIIDGHV